MTSEITVALLALLGTLAGTFGGIVTSSKLTAYRIEQLEKKVDKHNDFASRIPLLEHEVHIISSRMDALERREKYEA
ncbi:MAG: hypothetical protein IJL63_01175 [Clostridia bacterium]|nr:hypothetical protein [Clostridia bacterium]